MVKDKNVILTGAGGGIGKVITRHFLNAGDHLILIDISEENLRQLKKSLNNNNGEIDYYVADISSEDDVQSMFEKIKKKYDRIDVLINNAGIQKPIGPFKKNNLKLWKKNVEVNLIGAVNMTHSVLPSMIRYRKGKIINLSGGGSTSPRQNFSAYAVAKTGIVRFTEILALELSEYNIDVNAISPGSINTKMLDEVIESKEFAGKEFKDALKRKSQGGNNPEIAASLISYLASDDSDGITGKLISAIWDPWNTKEFQDLCKSDRDFATLRRIDNKYFYSKI